MTGGREVLGRIGRWASSHPFAVDATLAAVVGTAAMATYLATEPTGSERPQDAFGAALIVVLAAGVACRRVATFRSLLVVIAANVVFWVADYPIGFDPFAMLSLYAATAHGGPDRRRVWGFVGAAVALLTVIAVAGVLSPTEDLPAAAVVGIAAVHLTAAVAGEIVFERRQRLAALEQRAVRAEAERELLARQAVLDERSRIARDLHDIVAHGMSVMVVQAGAARRVVEARPDEAARALDHIQTTGRQALQDMRRMLGLLRDLDAEVDLAPQPVIADVGQIVERCIEAGFPTELVIEGEHSCPSAATEMTGYRIVQEALTNVIKHAGHAARASVRICYLPDALRVEVSDDGRGATIRDVERSTGHGLIGMRERVELYGGRFHAGPRPGGGFRVAATIPVEPVEGAG